MTFKVTLSHEPRDLHTLREEWQALQLRSVSRGVYLTWEFVATWWEHFGADNDLWLLQARNSEGRLVGLGALVLVKHQPQWGSIGGRRWRQLQFIGCENNQEHLGFLAEKGLKREVILAFVNEIHARRNQRAWDVLYMSGLTADGVNYAAMQSLPIPWEKVAEITAPYIPLPKTFEEYFERLSAPKRKAQRRRLRLLDKDFPQNWAFERVHDPTDLKPTLDKLVALHQAVWEARGEEGAFGNPRRKAFLYALAERFLAAGWLRLYRMVLAGDIVAVLFSYHYKGRVFDFASGINWDYRDYNVGHVVTQLALQQAIEEGADEYDFLWGTEPYKYEWRAQDRAHYTLIWHASWQARLQHQVFKTARLVYHRLRGRPAEGEGAASSPPAPSEEE